MSSRASAVRDEKGVALPLALFALLMLTGLLVAFLTMSGMEPSIAANLTDVVRARYVAEAGVEWAFDQLVLNTNWNGVLATNGGVMASGQTLPGFTPAFGTYAAQIRNDDQNGDPALTGLPLDGGVVGGNPATDANGAVVLTASGTYRGVTRQIQVVVRRVPIPPFGGAYTMPGVQGDWLASNTNFNIDGRDYLCATNCTNTDFAQRTYGINPDQTKTKYGIAVEPGTQQNSNPQISYEARVEQGLNSATKRSNVVGKDQTNPGSTTTGYNTVAPDSGVDPAVMQSFLDALASFSQTTVLQSTMACPMVLTGNLAGTYTSTPTLTNGCGANQAMDLGSRQNPKLVYFRGELDPTSTFTGLRLRNNIQGSGILVIEDGDLRTVGNLRWDGIVIVTGRYVSSIFDTGSNTTIFGATVSNETVWNEGGNQNQTPYYDGWFGASSVNLRYSQEAIDLVQRRLLFRISTWREL